MLLCAGAGAEVVLTGGLALSPALGVACCAIAAVAGRACDAKRERCERLRRHAVTLEAALVRERASRHVLQLSHERLAQQLAGAPHSLQASVEVAVPRLAALQSVAEFGRLLLDLLAQHAELQGGAVFVVDGEGRLLEQAVARSGCAGADSDTVAGSRLVLRAFRTRRLTSVVDAGGVASVGAAGGLGAASDHVLAALPLLAADAMLLGVVAIEQMPFTAFHPAALRQAFVLVSRVAGEVEPKLWRGWIERFECATAKEVARSRSAGEDDEPESSAAGRTKWGRIV
jgi:hypothetical protein